MSTTAPAAPAQDTKLDAAVLRIASVVVIGALMSILDITVVSIAQQSFVEAFHVNLSTAAWTATGYTLALATVIPLTGWAADRFGTKRLYLTALILFTAGSALCAMAWNIGSLIFFRVIQGFGGGMLVPLGLTIMTKAAGPERVGRVMAVMGIPMLLGPIGGPILGGWLIQAASWHWIFLINVPIGIIALVLATMLLPKDNPQPSEPFDVVGMLLMSPGLALFLYGVSSIPEAGTIASARVLIPGIIGLVLIAAFVWHAMRKEHPLIDLKLFKNRNLTVATVTMTLFSVAFFGAMLLFPQYFIFARGRDPLPTSILLIPQGVGAMISMPVAGRLTDKYGPGRFVLSGIVLIALSMVMFTQLTSTTPIPLLLATLFVTGLGMGMTMMPIMSAAMATLTQHSVARGSTLINIIQQSAGSIGTAVMTVILTNQILGNQASAFLYGVFVGQVDPSKLTPDALASGQAAMAHGFANTFWVALVLVILCLVPAFFLPRRKPGTGSPARAQPRTCW